MSARDIVRFLSLAAISFWVMPLFALTETVNGITWTYSIENGYAVISTGTAYSRAVSPAPTGHLAIPKTLGGRPVTIGESAFYGCSGITSVSVPDCVTAIGGSSFRGCSSLTTVTIPDNVNGIGGSAFHDCTSLMKIAIPSSVRRIGPNAFKNCSKLVDVTVEYGVTEIAHSAFYGCSSLTNIVIPLSVTSISNDVFSGCNKLASITLPFVGHRRGNAGTKDSLFGYVFGENSYSGGIGRIQKYSDSQSVTYYIPSSLRTVIITDETKIGYGAFRNCQGLTSVVLPNSVRDIGDYSFEYCSDLESIRLPEVLDQSVGSTSNTLGYASFRYCSSLINVAIPHGIINTRGSQFKDCVNLENVVFPDSITGLGGQSFSGCASLKSMFFPKGVTLIGEKAFYNCTSLSTIVFKGNAPEVDADGFTGVPSSCCTYVRKDSTGWNVDIQGRWKGLLIDYSHYNVSFNANGGEGAMAAQTIYMGETAELMPCAFTRSDGYVFAGWATNSNGAVVYGDKASVYDLSDELNTAVTLYATWERRFVNVETGNGTVAVPVVWLDETGIDLTAGYQTAAEQSAANGRPVWECFVTGNDPTNAASIFTAAISVSNNVPYITWSPNLNTNGIVRKYTILGKESLTDTVDWAPTNSTHRFFKVKVEMP